MPRDCKHGHLARSCEVCKLERERDEARGLVAELVEVMGEFPFDAAMRMHHVARRHVRQWRAGDER